MTNHKYQTKFIIFILIVLLLIPNIILHILYNNGVIIKHYDNIIGEWQSFETDDPIEWIFYENSEGLEIKNNLKTHFKYKVDDTNLILEYDDQKIQEYYYYLFGKSGLYCKDKKTEHLFKFINKE